jgi:hypothetical protein
LPRAFNGPGSRQRVETVPLAVVSPPFYQER